MSKKPSSKKSANSVTKPKPKPKPKATTPDTLPAAIVNALPVAGAMMKHLAAAAALIPDLERQLAKSRKSGVASMARAFVALHRLEARFDELLRKPLFGKDQIYDRYAMQEIPALFEQEGITSLPLAEGFRVGLSKRFLASIKPDCREQAYQWLRDNGLGDLITSVVNAGTLSAAGKSLMEERNMELPEEFFTVALVPNTSVTKTKNGANGNPS